ncbi:pentatricopeptide repeat-containing protein [Tanacetum coccineum]
MEVCPKPKSSLSRNLFKNGNSDELLEVFEILSDKEYFDDMERYNVMVSFLCKAGNVKEAYEWGVDPDGNTYIVLLKGFCQDNDLEAALEVFKKCFEQEADIAQNILGKIIYLRKEGHFTAASDLVLNYTSTIKNLGSNMILQKILLLIAGEVLVCHRNK